MLEKICVAFVMSVAASADVGVRSHYTEVFSEWAAKWPGLRARAQAEVGFDSRTVKVLALETASDPWYQGFAQYMRVGASIERVEQVLGDFEGYKNLFPKLANVKKVNLSGEREFTVAFEQEIPLFFVPNIRYELLYSLSVTGAGAHLWRYQLKQAGSVKNMDGLIALEAVSKGSTDYTEFDFFNSEWGPAKLLGRESIWKESLEDLVVSDLALKFLAEDPGAKPQEMRKRAFEELSRFPEREVLSRRMPFQKEKFP